MAYGKVSIGHYLLGDYMTIKEIKEKIKDTDLQFETYIDKGRIKYNHNVLVNDIYRLVASDKVKSRWSVMYRYTPRAGVTFLTEPLTLSNALIFVKESR